MNSACLVHEVLPSPCTLYPLMTTDLSLYSGFGLLLCAAAWADICAANLGLFFTAEVCLVTWWY